MEQCDEIHLGDIGTHFEITLYEDCETFLPGVENATVKKVIFKRDDGTAFIRDAVFLTDGTDSIILYETVDGDLDKTGNWEIQAYIETPLGRWYSSVDCFEVFENLMEIV